MIENRKHPRKSITSEVAFQVGDGPRIEARYRDIRLGGMFVETETTLPYGAQLRLFLRLPGLRDETVIDATVRWWKREGMGVQFGRMGARETMALTLLLSG